jgi:type I restriction enzyme S subunit
LFLPDKIWQIEAKEHIADCLWLSYVLKSNRTKTKISEAATGTSKSMRNITQEAFLAIDIILPPLPEQRKIAAILSTWDEAITKTQQLIAQLQQRNKGLMQQLLTGKKRLKGFEGEWKNIPLGSIIEEFREQSAGNNQYEVLTSSKRGLVKQRDYFGANRLSERDNEGFNVIPSGYITYRSRSDDGIFTFNINEFDFTGIISIYYPVFKVKEGSNRYIGSLLNFFNHKVGRYSVGTSQLVLSMNDLKSILFNIPPPKEQLAIENCLEMAFGEIKIQEQKLAALQQQKKGLMQKLFTGEVRVKV